MSNGFKQINVADRQTLVDIAMQEYGCYDGIFLLLKDNADRLNDLADIPYPGMVLNIQTPVPMINSTNQAVAAFYATNKTIVISSPVTVTIPRLVTPYSVPGYWVLGYSRPGFIALKAINFAGIPLSLLNG